MSGEHMSKEIIYEKKYPRIDPREELKNSTQEIADDPKGPIPTFEEIMQKNPDKHHVCSYARADQVQRGVYPDSHRNL